MTGEDWETIVNVLEQEPCEDCIDRAEAMTEMQMNARKYSLAKEFGGMGQVEWSDFLISIKDALNILRDLPSVHPKTEQEPKTGHWIMHIDDLFPAESTMECSECGEHQPITIDDNYCPNCGYRMKSEDTE